MSCCTAGPLARSAGAISIAQQPESLRLRFVGRRSRHLRAGPCSNAVASMASASAAQVTGAVRVRDNFDQRMPGMLAAQRRAGAGHMGEQHRPVSPAASPRSLRAPRPPHPRNAAAASRAALSEGTPAQITIRSRNAGTQPQRRGGDDAQRAFRSDQQLLEVEAAIVLLERSQRRRIRCRRPAPPRARAPARASIRGAAPACRRHWSRSARRSWPSPCRPSVSGKRRPCASARFVQGLQDHPGLANRLPRFGIDGADRVHPPAATAGSHRRSCPELLRRTCRCSRPAARSRCRGVRTASPAQRLPPWRRARPWRARRR